MKTEEQLLHQLASLCASKECCLHELRQKLAKSELPEEAQERIVQRLQADHFVDEARFARSFANDKFRFNHWGRIKINYELSQKGIPSDVREEALASIEEEPYREALTELLRSKIRTTKAKNAYELVQKLLRFAASRGFESGLALECTRTLLNKEADDALDAFEMA